MIELVANCVGFGVVSLFGARCIREGLYYLTTRQLRLRGRDRLKRVMEAWDDFANEIEKKRYKVTFIEKDLSLPQIVFWDSEEKCEVFRLYSIPGRFGWYELEFSREFNRLCPDVEKDVPNWNASAVYRIVSYQLGHWQYKIDWMYQIQGAYSLMHFMRTQFASKTRLTEVV